MPILRSLFAGLLLALPAFIAAGAKPPTSPLIVGYVFSQDAALQPGEIDPNSMTRINYAFANIAEGRMVTGFAADVQNFAYLTALKRENPSLTVLVSVGGWLWSTNFSDISLTKQSREVFIQSAMDFLTRYDLDGLDVDWEYPGMPGSGHPFRPEDKQNFTLLLKELRQRFTQQSAKTHKRMYLTIAAGASDQFIAHTEMAEVQHYVDTVNLMAYDYYEPSSDAMTGHHAPLLTDSADPKKISADVSVKAFEQAGVPAAKIILGVPFYGHMWGQVADANHGLFQPGKPIPKAYAPYSVIVQTMLDQGFVRYWDATALVPYLYSPDKQIFVSYEDPESLAAKGKYVRTHKLGGIMFWDYEGDPSGTLLKAVRDSLRETATEYKGVK
jgi:chitinase